MQRALPLLAALATVSCGADGDNCHPVTAPPQLNFTEVSAQAGLTHVQTIDRVTFGCTLIDVESTCGPAMTGGAAAADFDQDGWVDLAVTRWDAPLLLYRNRGDGTFVDVAAEAGVLLPKFSNDPAWGDIDGDGDLDLYVTTMGDTRFHLFINGLAEGARTPAGLPRFHEDAQQRGAALEDATSPTWGFSASFGDFNRDGWLDLHTTEWRRTEGPDSRLTGRVRLLANRGASAPGFFTDATEAAGVVAARKLGTVAWEVRAFTSTFADFDNDGWPDLAIASDFGTSRLFWNQGNGTFTDGTAAAGVARETNAMGSTVGDFDGDGRLDWFVTSIHDPDTLGTVGNRLYRNRGGRRFDDATDTPPVATVRAGSWAWGASFFDPDSDGDLDLIQTNGMDLGPDDRYLMDPLRFWQNRGGNAGFEERSAAVGLADTADGKAVVVFDFDRDGDDDVFVANSHGAARLFRNDTQSGGSWLRVELRGEGGNRFAVGAHLVADACGQTVTRTIDASSTFLGQNPAEAHFGFGATQARTARLRITWPDGREQRVSDVATGRAIRIDARGVRP